VLYKRKVPVATMCVFLAQYYQTSSVLTAQYHMESHPR